MLVKIKLSEKALRICEQNPHINPNILVDWDGDFKQARKLLKASPKDRILHMVETKNGEYWHEFEIV